MARTRMPVTKICARSRAIISTAAICGSSAFFKPSGHYLLDAGSGPVQYAEYLTYSEGYQRRVCVDISIVALQEARRRIGEHGLFVVADVANLPFTAEPFDGVVSLHTLHHLPLEEQAQSVRGAVPRARSRAATAVVVNGWTDSPLMRRMSWLVRGMERLGAWAGQTPRAETGSALSPGSSSHPPRNRKNQRLPKEQATGTFINKLDAAWLRAEAWRQDAL